MPQTTPLQQAIFKAIGFGKEFGPADVARVLDELAIVIGGICAADRIMYERFIVHFERALTEGERWFAEDEHEERRRRRGQLRVVH